MLRSAVAGIALLAALVGSAFAGATEGPVVQRSAAPPDAFEETEPTTPNIVVIVGDDIGWTDYGFMGDSTVRTPALDDLARSGTTFRVGHLNASLCIPTHFDLLTGVHHERWARPATDRTMPREVAASGYRTFQAGKLWAFDAADWGFTDSSEETCEKHLSMVACGRPDWGRAGWSTAECGRFARDGATCPATEDWRAFLDSVDVGSGERFLAVFTPKLPHAPVNPPRSYVDLYRGAGLTRRHRAAFAMISWFDDVVFEILLELERRQLRSDTVVVYLADNGLRSEVSETAQLAAAPKFRGKGSHSELGMRTPILISWPSGGVAEGAVRDDLVSVADVYATVIDLAGGEIRPDSSGISLVPTVVSDVPHPRAEIATHFGKALSGGYVLRTPEWRYVRWDSGDAGELYAISTDPMEQVNRIDDVEPSLLRGFDEKLAIWRAANPKRLVALPK